MRDAKWFCIGEPRCGWLAIAFGVLFVLNVHPLFAQRPRIRLDAIAPAGAAAGEETSVTISGELTESATGLLFSHPDIEAHQQINAPTEYTVAHRKPRQFTVQVPADVPDGRYDVRAVGPAGVSGPRSFLVSRLRHKMFNAGGNSREKPFAMSVGDIVNATARADQRDFYQFSAEGGQNLLVQIWADRLDSRMDALFAIYDVQSGKRLHRVRQSLSRDPILSFTAPKTGEYVVEVWEATFRGGTDYFYRLEISTRSHVESIFPAVAQPGKEQEFEVYGFNLPGGVPISGIDGNLQSIELTFAPDFSGDAYGSEMAFRTAAAARINGGGVSLPVPLSTSRVFLSKADSGVTKENAADEGELHAQRISAPGIVAGQLYPRRDVDWYQFNAKKGDVYWIEVAMQQLGVQSDPVLRVGRRQIKDGHVQLLNVSTSDDIKGAPNNRDSRRFYTGTGDSALRYRVPEDGEYLIALSDQYNVASDDPRLSYQLTVRSEQPDFQLVAFSEPERHADDKIAKPNGVSLAPGGSALIRVRLLPQHSFRGNVRVTAVDLPPGVEAHPVTLSSKFTERHLILTASAAARPAESKIRVVGEFEGQGKKLRREARSGTIQRSVNNIDAEATDVRLCDDLIVSVGEYPLSPLRFDRVSELVTSVGAKLNLPVTLHRDASIKDQEIELLAGVNAKGIKVTTLKTKANTADVVADFSDAKFPPGRYSISLAAKLKQKRPRDLVAVREAEADLAKVKTLVAERNQNLQFRTSVFQLLQKSTTQLTQARDQAKAALTLPKQKVAEKLEQSRVAATELAEKIRISVENVDDATLVEAVKVAEARLEELREERNALLPELQRLSAPLLELEALLAAKQAELKKQQQEVDDLKKKAVEAAAKLKEAEKRVVDVTKAQLEKDADFYAYAPPIVVDVKSTPVANAMSSTPTKVPVGSQADVLVTLRRQFGFDGTVSLSLEFPKESGLSSAVAVLGNGQSVARIPVAARADTKPGVYQGKLASKLTFNQAALQDDSTIKVEVVAVNAAAQ